MSNEELVKRIDEAKEAIRQFTELDSSYVRDIDGLHNTLNFADELLQQARDAIPVWRSVEDRFPEPGQGVLYYFELVGTWPGKYHGDGESNVFGGLAGFLTDDVTHWMPLPVPPANEVSE